MNQKTHQGGWIAKFIIVGVVLIALALVVVYFIKSHHNMFDHVKQPSNESSQQQAPSQSSESKTDSGKSNQPSDDQTKQQPTQTAPPATNSSPSSTDNLPHTGPADSLPSVIAVTFLTFTVVSYVQSRRI